MRRVGNAVTKINLANSDPKILVDRLGICCYDNQHMNICSDIKLIEIDSQPSLNFDETAASHLAQLFGALADPSRLRIIAALVAGEKNVSTLAEVATISESAVSHHLRDLRQLRIVKTRKEGRFVFYALDDEHVVDLFLRGLEHVRHG